VKKVPKKTKSFGGKMFSGKRKLYKSLGGKIILGKKACAFEWCLVISQKYAKSFGGKKILHFAYGFYPSKSRVYF